MAYGTEQLSKKAWDIAEAKILPVIGNVLLGGWNDRAPPSISEHR